MDYPQFKIRSQCSHDLQDVVEESGHEDSSEAGNSTGGRVTVVFVITVTGGTLCGSPSCWHTSLDVGHGGCADGSIRRGDSTPTGGHTDWDGHSK